MKDDREKILSRVREALRAVAPQPHHGTATASGAGPAPFRAWLPPVGPGFEDRLALFAKQSEVLRTEFVVCDDAAAAAAHLGKLAAENGWQTLALHPGVLTDAVAAHLPASLSLLSVKEGYDRDGLEGCQAGLTECESLVAQTGSICVTARSSGGRTLSVLPHHHIALATRGQLVADLSAAYEALALKYGSNYPSFISFISGPSRTGDIERILVLGAHGPKKLTVLLLP